MCTFRTTKFLLISALLACLKKFGIGRALFGIPLLFCALWAQASELSVNVWHKNERVPSTFEFIQLALEKAKADEDFEYQFEIKTIENNEQAYAALAQKDKTSRLDVMVAGVSVEREKDYLPIYVPLDRGLLGFRVCLITLENQNAFRTVNQVSDFAQQNLSMSLVKGWPDVSVMQQNNIPVLETLDYEKAVQQIQSQKADCFSRSVIEIGTELQNLQGVMADTSSVAGAAFIEERHMALIYPFADIIYVNPHNPELHRLLSDGLEMALADRSFFHLHDDHYQQLLVNHRFYARKLLIMENRDLSEAAHEAINRYGIASFNKLRKRR